MTTARARATELVDEADATDWSPECGALLAEAIAVAEAGGEHQLAYAARMRLCVNSSMVDDSDLLVSTFVQCYQAHLADPAAFPADPGDLGPEAGPHYGFANLFWIWKWIPNRLLSNPRVPLPELRDTLAEMEEFFVASGQPTKSVASRRLLLAAHTGELEAVAELLPTVQAMPDDEHSDCRACSLHDYADLHRLLGDEDAARAEIARIVTERAVCAEEPEAALSSLLLLSLRAGERDDLARVQRQSYAAVRDNPGLLKAVGDHLIALAVTGAHLRTLTLTGRHLPWLVHDRADRLGHFSLLLGVAVALSVADAEGWGGRALPPADDPALVHVLGGDVGGPGAADAGHTVSSTAVAAWAAAERIAAQFDARNGTDAFAREVARHRAIAEHERYHGVEWDLPPEPAEAFAEDPVLADAAGGDLFALASLPAEDPAQRQVAGERARGLALTIPDLIAAGEHDRALVDAVEYLRLARTIGSSESRAAAAVVLGQACVAAGRRGEAEVAAGHALELLRGGSGAVRLRVTLEAAMVLLDAQCAEDALEVCEYLDTSPEFAESATASDRADLHVTLGHARSRVGKHLKAAQAYLAAAGDFEDAGDPVREVRSAAWAALALRRGGSRGQAARVAEVALATAAGLPADAAPACADARADAMEIVADARERSGEPGLADAMRVAAQELRDASA